MPARGQSPTWQRALKRACDVLLASIACVCLLPVFALLALAIKLSSPGPVLHRRRVVGRRGHPFDAFKFRTMRPDADSMLDELPELKLQYTANYKLMDDPRRTPIGRFLRKYSLDELPQLFNVLRGEMSLVGPRPALPSEVARYRPHHFVRFEVLPGITGPWQVSGRNTITDFEAVVKLEAAYIRGWSVWRDLAILARTVPAVLSMKGAY